LCFDLFKLIPCSYYTGSLFWGLAVNFTGNYRGARVFRMRAGDWGWHLSASLGADSATARHNTTQTQTAY